MLAIYVTSSQNIAQVSVVQRRYIEHRLRALLSSLIRGWSMLYWLVMMMIESHSNQLKYCVTE